MPMMKADHAQVSWDPQKKSWMIRIQAGEEVVKRHPDKAPSQGAADDQLRSLAIDTAHGEGYEIDPAAVSIAR
jgi:hypothetical protein